MNAGTRLSTRLAALVARPGLLFKRLTLLVGAVFFTCVTVTNIVDFVATVGGYDWVVLNSGNASYIDSITKAYSMPSGFTECAVFAAALVEGIGAVLFWRALARFRGDGRGVREAWWALTWNVFVWLGFIVGTEVFVAYPSEGTFRQLLIIGLGMALVIAVVPDDPAATIERSDRR
jgi:hypothetical protein